MSSPADELERLRRRAARERAARKEAERIAEEKTRELYESNRRLTDVGERLHELVEARTEQLAKARDEAVAANRAKSAFLANMSHELRTPLNAIIGYSEMILEDNDALDAQLRADVGKVEKAGRHLLSLINDVLDLSKVEAGKMGLFRETVGVSTLVADIADTVAPLAQQSGNVFTATCSEDVGDLHTDVVKLRQILFNLLSNAFKFTSNGNVSLHVTRQAGIGRLVFEVADDGIGMTPEVITQIFTPFAQGDASTTRRFGGTGLGLALTRRFCELLGGEIAVHSREGEGSRFSFWLPESAEPQRVAASPREAIQSESREPVVLVVDDDEAMHDLMARHLSGSGLRVVATADPAQAIPLARAVAPVMITLDVLMPRKDGWSVLSELKQDRDLQHIPVVLLSIVDERGFGFALGAADYLVKPVARERLLETVRRHAVSADAKRALIVEDEEATRALMTRALRRDGWSVSEASNGREALSCFAEVAPSVILLDLMMPEMDGFEFLGALREEPAGADIPVVVVTAKDLTEEEVAFFRGRAQAVLRKSIHDREKLVSEVKRQVDRVLSARELQGEKAGKR
ncbi:MAG: response regulator [Sandaracinaceae bacterium]